MAQRTLEEEALPEKFNLGIWKKIFRYLLRHPLLLAVGLLGTLFVSFYDASFVPVMNAGAIAAGENLASMTDVPSIWQVAIPVTFIFGIRAEFSFVSFMVTLIVMILVRSALIIVTFYVTNLISLTVICELRHDCFIKIQKLSFSYFDSFIFF